MRIKKIVPAAEVVVKRRRFKDRADLAQGLRAVLEHGNPVDGDVAAVGHDHAEDDAERGAFPSAVVAEEAVDFAALDVERDIGECRFPAEVFEETVSDEHGWGGGQLPAAKRGLFELLESA